MRCELVVKAMAGYESDWDGFSGGRGGVLEDGDWRGGDTPGCGGFEARDVGEVGEGGEASAADYCDSDGVWRGGVRKNDIRGCSRVTVPS